MNLTPAIRDAFTDLEADRPINRPTQLNLFGAGVDNNILVAALSTEIETEEQELPHVS